MLKVVIAKVDENIYDGEADSVTLPGSSGEMTVLHNHEPLITTLKAGTITVRSAGSAREFAVDGGVLEVRRDGITVIL